MLTRKNEQVDVQQDRSRILVNSFGALQSALIADLGIQRLPASVADPEIKVGRLVEVLRGWALSDLGTYAIWPDTSCRSSLTRLLIDHIGSAV